MSSQGPYLFLQGPSSPLFSNMAGYLTRAGRACYRINLNVGDQIFWRRGGASNYRGRAEDWSSFVQRFVQDYGIKTVIVFGEERPYHREAIRVAKAYGATVVAVEMGYLRPDWVTVERDGLSSNSHFPNDPLAILEAAENLPEPHWPRRFNQTFLAEALFDLAYYLPASFLWFLYPHYRFHGISHPLREYAGWIGRLITKRRRSREAANLQRRLMASPGSYFVYPLQLETDYQLRSHSPFNSQREAIELVLRSFAARADKDARLAVKTHPLDNGLISWRKVVQATAEHFSIADRVVFLDGGDLGALFNGACGIVTVNSTAALAALSLGLRAKVLGSAIYDIPGLTAQEAIDDFWQSEGQPDEALKKAFFRLVAYSIQERGNFCSYDGADAAARAIARRLLEGRLNADSGGGLRRKPVKLEKPKV